MSIHGHMGPHLPANRSHVSFLPLRPVRFPPLEYWIQSLRGECAALSIALKGMKEADSSLCERSLSNCLDRQSRQMHLLVHVHEDCFCVIR